MVQTACGVGSIPLETQRTAFGAATVNSSLRFLRSATPCPHSTRALTFRSGYCTIHASPLCICFAMAVAASEMLKHIELRPQRNPCRQTLVGKVNSWLPPIALLAFELTA